MARIRTRLGLLVVAITVIAAVVYWRFPDTTVTEEDRQTAEQARQFLDFSRTTDDTPIPITVGTVQMVIPGNYFVGVPEPGAEKDATLLEALLPDLAPYTESNRDQFHEPGWNNRISILIQHFRNAEPSLEPIIEGEFDLRQPLGEFGQRYGLRYFEPLNENAVWNENVYLMDGADPYLMTCNSPDREDLPSPSCTLKIYVNELYINITFSLNFAQSHEAILHKLSDLIEEFLERSNSDRSLSIE